MQDLAKFKLAVNQTSEDFDRSHADEALNLINQEFVKISLQTYRVVGNYVRYDQMVRNRLKDLRDRIVIGLKAGGIGQENYLIWGAPGSGKTSFVEEIGNSFSDFEFRKLKLTDLNREAFEEEIVQVMNLDRPVLCLVDEVDSKPSESWPNEVLLTPLEKPCQTSRTCFVLVGSGGSNISGLKQIIASRSKGPDLLRCVSFKGEYEVTRMNLADRLTVALSHLITEAKKAGLVIHEVEKLALLYIALNRQLVSPSKVSDLAIACIRRIPKGVDRVRYDFLFEIGDVECHQFWQDWHEKCPSGCYVYVEE
jgi:hypothetical protein